MPSDLPITKETITEIFSGHFGEPKKKLKKIVGWRPRPELSIVVELDSPREGVYVWIPAIERGITPIDCPCELYAAGKSRHHGVARFVGLGENDWALRFRPRSGADVVAIAKAMVARLPRSKQGKG